LVLGYSFTEYRQFCSKNCWPSVLRKIMSLAAKTDRNFVFFGRDPHIPDRLYIMILYMNFMCFKNFKFLFKIICFAAKTDRNSVFLVRDSHIMDQQYIMVPYMSFYGYSKISNFCSRSISVSLRF
jgi:hypothetical protein